MKNKQKIVIGFFIGLLFLTPAHAESGDLSLEGIRPSETVIVGQPVRLYATVRNNSNADLLGTVKFFDETAGAFLGDDQPVSVIAGETDTVFVDWLAESQGDKTITARVIPWDDDLDNADNNKTSAVIYADVDSDGDGTPNRQDVDDDNDGVNDDVDAFPLDSSESVDSDGDGEGDNADVDDDNDGVPDVEDVFTTDPNETKDSDGDGVGDNADAFPDDFDESVDEDGDGLGANVDPDDNNKGPIVQISTGESKLVVGQPILFDASTSYDEDGEIDFYEWDFGEGYEVGTSQMDYVYDRSGPQVIRIKVTDDKGEYRASELTIEIREGFNLLFWIGIPGLVILISGALILFRRKTLRKAKK